MMLSKKGIEEVLISLRICAGWTARLLFANLKDRCPCIEAHMSTALKVVKILKKFQTILSVLWPLASNKSTTLNRQVYIV